MHQWDGEYFGSCRRCYIKSNKKKEKKKKSFLYKKKEKKKEKKKSKILHVNSLIALLALIPDSRPYCVGMYSVTKGTDSFALSTAHREVVNAVKEAGLHVVTLPGDGDVTLRSFSGASTLVKDTIGLLN